VGPAGQLESGGRVLSGEREEGDEIGGRGMMVRVRRIEDVNLAK
jgi:hypothetical protein